MNDIFGIKDGEEVKTLASLRESEPEAPQQPLEDPIIKLLHRALAEELNAWFQYWIEKDVIRGLERSNIEEAFDEFMDDELEDHATRIKQRLIELGDNLEAVNSPSKWNLVTPNKFVQLGTLTVQKAILLNIQAERNAIDTYEELYHLTKENDDITTNKLAKDILEDEHEHLRVLQDFADDLELEY